jgi:hypothetical protein
MFSSVCNDEFDDKEQVWPSTEDFAYTWTLIVKAAVDFTESLYTLFDKYAVLLRKCKTFNLHLLIFIIEIKHLFHSLNSNSACNCYGYYILCHKTSIEYSH